jgi:hypothetical protein
LNQSGAPAWKIVAIGDFNQDGHPDIVWQEESTRRITVHYYGWSGGAVFQGRDWLDQSGSPGWHVVGAADFNGDSYADLVWQHDMTRDVAVYYYGGNGGATLQGWKYLNQTRAVGWSVVAIADF